MIVMMPVVVMVAVTMVVAVAMVVAVMMSMGQASRAATGSGCGTCFINYRSFSQYLTFNTLSTRDNSFYPVSGIWIKLKGAICHTLEDFKSTRLTGRVARYGFIDIGWH